jgi:hypothetical protein
MVLSQEPTPCPVGKSTYNPDQAPYENIKHNDEAIVILEVFGEEDVEEPVEEPVDVSEELTDEEPLEEDFQGEDSQNLNVSDDVEPLVGELVSVPAEPEDPKDRVAGDFVIEVVAGSMNRLTEIVTWVNMKLAELLPDTTVAIRDYVAFTPFEAISVGSDTKFASSTRVIEDLEGEDS